MSRRRAVRAAAATAVALLGAAGALVGAGPAAAAAKPTHVAIEVAGVGARCIAWHSGMTGADVLVDGHLDPVFGERAPYVGFLLTVEGRGTDHPDDTHYWAYYHDSGSGWVYSSAGAAGYEPRAGTVEGWAFDNGQANAPKPPAVSYASICKDRDAPPRPSPTPKPRTSAPPSRPISSSVLGPSPSSPAQPSRPTTPAATPTSMGAHHGSTSARPSPARSTRDSSTPSRGPPAAMHPSGASTGPAASITAPPLANGPGGPGGSAWGTAIVLAVVAALGVTAGWLAWARRRA